MVDNWKRRSGDRIMKSNKKEKIKEETCPKCGGQLWRDEHPDGVAVGSWSCSNCEWYQETPFVDYSLQNDLPF